jgi:type III pantothenate kinase
MGDLKHTFVLDAGNTQIKAAVFEGENLIESLKDPSKEECLQLLQKYKITASIISESGKGNPELTKLIGSFGKSIILSHLIPVPFKNMYATPETLGMDRVAGICGAQHLFPGKNCLVIDLGTCITYDFMDASGNYLGGAISPGLRMRLKAMHEFTDKLPLVEFQSVPDLIGNSTVTSMLSGTFHGMSGEIIGNISRYRESYGEVQVILTGGDSPLFGKHIEIDIFAAPDLVLYGLNKILLFNVQKGL